MLKEKGKIISSLASLFLSFKDGDEGYARVLEEIKQLYNERIFIDINKIQEVAYNGEVK